MQHDIDKVALTLHRLNNMWSFTGKRISYAADNYAKIIHSDPVDRLLDLVYAYAAITKNVTHYSEHGVQVPDEWSRLWGNVGQDIFFTLPEMLKKFHSKKFDKLYKKVFVKAWRESPLPPV